LCETLIKNDNLEENLLIAEQRCKVQQAAVQTMRMDVKKLKETTSTHINELASLINPENKKETV
jgi:hypothetical protein